MRPRAGVDLDGVVYQWEPTARGLLHAHWGVEISESQTWGWIADRLVERLGPALGKEATSWLYRYEGAAAGLWRLGEPYPDAIEALQRLSVSHDVVIITKRPRVALVDTAEWLLRHGVFPMELIVQPPDDSRPKSSVLCDWYVDDRGANVDELSEHCPESRVFLMDRPWNQEPTSGERVFGWLDLLEKVRGTR